MQLQFDVFSFRDFMNYTSPMSLAAFSKSCGIQDISKSVFPYELYTDVQQLRNEKDFPAYKEFQSSLGRRFNPSYVKEMKEIAKANLISGEWLDLR